VNNIRYEINFTVKGVSHSEYFYADNILKAGYKLYAKHSTGFGTVKVLNWTELDLTLTTNSV
jgi:hypothetical protein